MMVTIGIAAGKGGVGKSTVSVNLSLALQALGFAVGIMDADLYGPSIQKMLPEDRSPATSAGSAEIIPALCGGIELISMAYFRPQNEGFVVRSPIANGVIEQFVRDVRWGALDFLLIDFPPGTGDIQLSLCQKGKLSGALIVTTPQEVALLDVVKTVDFLQRMKVPILGVIENMSFFPHPVTAEPMAIFGRGGGAKLATQLSRPLLAQIPIDPLICAAADEGVSLLAKAPDSPSALCYMELAKKVRDLCKNEVASKWNL